VLPVILPHYRTLIKPLSKMSFLPPDGLKSPRSRSGPSSKYIRGCVLGMARIIHSDTALTFALILPRVKKTRNLIYCSIPVAFEVLSLWFRSEATYLKSEICAGSVNDPLCRPQTWYSSPHRTPNSDLQAYWDPPK